MNNNIKKRGFNKNKQPVKKIAKTRKIISHPLSRLFTTERYELTDKDQLIITFYECYLSNRFYYPRIEWNIPKNLLRFYTDTSKKEIKCVKLSLENCDKEKQIIDPKEAQLFIKNCKHFMREMITNQDEIKHMTFRKVVSDKNKMIMILGEYHIYDHKRNQRYIAFMMKFFNSFKTIPGMIIDFFIEANLNRKDINFERDRLLTYTPIYDSLHDSPHVRIHQIDYRGYSTFKPFETFVYYLLENKTYDISYVYSFLEIIKPLFDINLMKINFPDLLKQYQKINKVQFLRTLFLNFFENPFREVNWLINDINNFWKADEIQNLKKKQIEQEKYQKKINKSRFISSPNYTMDVWSRFMDLYTIGRILKPGYNYCVLHGGAFHTVDIVKTLEKHGLISIEDTSFPGLMIKRELDSYNELERNIDL